MSRAPDPSLPAQRAGSVVISPTAAPTAGSPSSLEAPAADETGVFERRWTRRGLFLVGFTALGLFFATRTYIVYNAYRAGSLSWRDAIVPSLADWYGWMLLAPGILWLTHRNPLGRATWRRALPVHLLAGPVVAVVRTLMDLGIAAALGELSDFPPLGRRFLNTLHSNVATYWVIVAIGHLLVFQRRAREREVRASQLEARLAQARLDALRMQLHPHFLFNTLHAVSTLMHRDVEAADRMIAQLSDLLRMALANEGVHEVPLKQELEFLERYLEIEQTRFRDRLEVRLEIPPETLDALVPQLILQPLVENAIRHGIAPRAGPGVVEVRARGKDGMLELSVRDDGPGTPVHGRPPTEGVGLANARARLEQLYGAAHRFELGNAPGGGFLVRLSLPLRRVPE